MWERSGYDTVVLFFAGLMMMAGIGFVLMGSPPSLFDWSNPKYVYNTLSGQPLLVASPHRLQDPHQPQAESGTAKTDESEFEVIVRKAAEDVSADRSPALEAVSVPPGLPGEWNTVSLDQDRVRLKMLNRMFALEETTNGSGAEYYRYASFLYEQLGRNLPEPSLQNRFLALSAQARQMAGLLRRASGLKYDGPPTGDMVHLRVRSKILYYLDEINPHAMRVMDVNQDGMMLGMPGPRKSFEPGSTLKAFLAVASEIEQDPAMANYPETMVLMRQQTDLLRQLAARTELRWESVFLCTGEGLDSCRTEALSMRIYMVQTTPDTWIQAVTQSLVAHEDFPAVNDQV